MRSPCASESFIYQFLQTVIVCFLLLGLTSQKDFASSILVSEHDGFDDSSCGQESRPDVSQKVIQSLRLGETVKQEMNGGEVHAFKITLTQGQYLRVLVEQLSIDVGVRLLSPDNRLLIEIDSPSRLKGPESISVVAEVSGDYTLQILSDKTTPAGSYEVRVEALREPTAADLRRRAAEQAFVEGQRLRFLRTAESLKSAIEKYKEALAQWKSLEDVRWEAYTLCNMGRAFKALRNRAEALDNLGQALALLQVAQDNAGQAFVLNEIGATYRDLDNPHKALEIYEQALTLRRTEDDPWGEAQVLNNIGIIYARTGYQQKALDKYNEAIPLWRAAHDSYNEVYTLNSLAGALGELGELSLALGYFEQVLNYCRKSGVCSEVGNRDLEILVNNNIGKIYDAWSDPQSALGYYAIALGKAQQLKNRWAEALVLNNEGVVHAELGDFQSALEFLNQSLDIYKDLSDSDGKAKTLTNIAYVYALQNDFKQTIEYIERAMPLSKQTDDKQFIAYALTSLGMAYVSSGEPRKALDYYRQALEIQQDLEDRRNQAVSLDKIGQALALLGDAQGALSSYNQALQHWIAVGDKQGQALTLYGIARVERDSNNLIESRNKIEEAINIIESLRVKLTSQQLRLTYFATKQDYYALDIDIRMQLFKLNHDEEDRAAALYASERARARNLLDILIEAHADIRQGIDPQLLERTRQLELELNSKVESSVRLRALGQKEDAAAVEKQLDALTVESERLQSQIRASSKVYADLKQPRPLGLKEIQEQLLDDDTLLLEYALGDKRSYLWAVSRSSIESYTLQNQTEIEKVTRELRKLLTAYEPPAPGESELAYLTRLRRATEQYWQQAAELSHMVLGPVASKLGTKRLVIVADGGLRYIPFEALPTPDANSPRGVSALSFTKERNAGSTPAPLVINHEIIYQPSISALALLRVGSRKATPKAVAVLADPVFNSNDERVLATRGNSIPNGLSQLRPAALTSALRDIGFDGGQIRLERLRFTLKEADKIIAAAPAGAAMKAVGFDANKRKAMSPELAQYRIVHFATHAILDDNHPERSGIVLSLVNEQGQPEEGFLRLHDIYNLNLPIDLVVLSACQTGIGKEVKGEGLIGLTRGFMYAGASRVVASLWKVDDEATAELMGSFYQHMLRDRMPASSALRRAQLEVMQMRGLWHAPYYWAGFVLQGEWR